MSIGKPYASPHQMVDANGFPILATTTFNQYNPGGGNGGGLYAPSYGLNTAGYAAPFSAYQAPTPALSQTVSNSVGAGTFGPSYFAPFSNEMSNWLGAPRASSGGWGASVSPASYDVGGGYSSGMFGSQPSYGDPYGVWGGNGGTANRYQQMYGGFTPPSSTSFQYGNGGWGSSYNPYSQPYSSAAWDPQGTARGMVFGNSISSALAQSNLNRVANYINNSRMFGNPYAGQAMASVAGAESAGNPFSVNSIGATGLFQDLNTRGSPRASNLLYNLGGNYSPEAQSANAIAEIYGGGYPGVAATLNNPYSSMQGMRGSVINQFEGLQGYPSQAAADLRNSAVYANLLQSTTNARGGAGVVPAGFNR